VVRFLLFLSITSCTECFAAARCSHVLQNAWLAAQQTCAVACLRDRSTIGHRYVWRTDVIIVHSCCRCLVHFEDLQLSSCRGSALWRSQQPPPLPPSAQHSTLIAFIHEVLLSVC
jgi:hypothetical protein